MTGTMKKTILVIACSAALVLGTKVITAEIPAQDTPDGNAEQGRTTYNEYGCVACHGGEAQGAGNTGPRLGPNPVPFARFSGYIRQPSGNMPPYTTEVVTVQELGDIYAFLKSIPAPPSPESVLPDD